MFMKSIIYIHNILPYCAARLRSIQTHTPTCNKNYGEPVLVEGGLVVTVIKKPTELIKGASKV